MKSWCKLPDDDDYTEICRSYVKEKKYIGGRIVQLLVLPEA